MPRGRNCSSTIFFRWVANFDVKIVGLSQPLAANTANISPTQTSLIRTIIIALACDARRYKFFSFLPFMVSFTGS
jgi:hypothetical protein